jgi:hypothetical protein
MEIFLKYFRIYFTKQLTYFCASLYIAIHFLKNYWIKALTVLHMVVNTTCITLWEDHKLQVLDVTCTGNI